MPSADSTSNSTPALPLGRPPALSPALEAAFASGALLIAPSAPATRQLRETFNAVQRARGLLAWEPAPVVSWSQWLDSLWSDTILSGSETRLLLNETQEHSLWANLIPNTTQPAASQPSTKQSSTAPSLAKQSAADSSSESPEAPLASADSLVTLARSAWNLASSYNAVSRLRSAAATHDARTFALWAERFARECERNAFLSRAGFEAALQTHVAAGTLAAPPRLDFAGFADLTPAQQNLLDTFRTAGSEIALHETTLSPNPEAERTIFCAKSEPEELLAIAHWIRRFIQQRQASGLTSRVGVLLPDLDADRAAVEAVFREILAPELQPIARDLSSTPYEFAAGQPLASVPLIAVALDLVRWLEGPLPLGNVSALLLSPYLGAPAGLNQSAQFDACNLRQLKLLRPEIGLSALHKLARKSTYGKAPLTWLEPLNRFIENAGSLRSTREFAAWAEFFRSLVQSAGWPSERPLTSNEFHTTRAWDDALDALATLDFQGRKASLREALRALERNVASAAFTPPPTGASVQIMGPASATGLTFDALVLARATDTNYPQPERTNPLLGWSLQASLDMPGASQAHAAERAHRALDARLTSADTVLITFAEENVDGEQRLSPAFAELGWPQQPAADWLAANLPASSLAAPVEEELVEDNDPLPPLPGPLVHGGSAVLQCQAACGFRAFAEFRLRATELDQSDTGFNALENGNVLHRALEKFWTKVRSQENLRNLTDEARTALLKHYIAASFDGRLVLENNWDKAYVDIQQQRLLTLLQQWLDLELQRGPFEVLDRELGLSISLGPLDLKLRIDRLDRVKDGVFLVDYKTGQSANPDQWLGLRPDEPQLPLYALLPEAADLRGLAFAKVRAGKDMKWLGYEAEKGYLPPTRSKKNNVDLRTQIDEWRNTLTELAEAFAHGDASVGPKDYPNTCKHCAQRLLCRLDPASLLNGSDDEHDESQEDSDG